VSAFEKTGTPPPSAADALQVLGDAASKITMRGEKCPAHRSNASVSGRQSTRWKDREGWRTHITVNEPTASLLLSQKEGCQLFQNNWHPSCLIASEDESISRIIVLSMRDWLTTRSLVLPHIGGSGNNFV
jgi:hypothetical protein